MYLATVPDLCSKELIGYALAPHMRASLAVEVIAAVHRTGLVAGNAIMHTDRGSIPCEGLSERVATAGGPAKHQPQRILSRRCRRRVLLRHDQGGDRRRLLARPCHRPPRDRQLDQEPQRATAAFFARVQVSDRGTNQLAATYINRSIGQTGVHRRVDSGASMSRRETLRLVAAAALRAASDAETAGNREPVTGRDLRQQRRADRI